MIHDSVSNPRRCPSIAIDRFLGAIWPSTEQIQSLIARERLWNASEDRLRREGGAIDKDTN